MAGVTLALASIFLVGTAASSPSAVSPLPRAVECAVEGLPSGSRCAVHTVSEDRTRSSSRRVLLRSVVVPASEPAYRGREAVLFIAGGPGLPSTSLAPQLAPYFRSLLARRDLVLIDQRGTSGEAAFNCAKTAPAEERLRVLFPLEEIAACRQELAQRADLTRYGTADAADDLDEILGELGYHAVDVYGASYGSRLAMEMLHRHPRRMRTVVLEAVVADALHGPLDYARNAQQALERTLAACAADPPCRAAFPDLGSELASLVSLFDEGPVAVRVPGKARPLPFTRGAFGYAVRGLLYDMNALQLPLMIHRAAAAGDPSAFARRYLERDALDSSIGLHLTIMCTEDLPRSRAMEAEAATADTLIGSWIMDGYSDACRVWDLPATPYRTDADVDPTVPVLLLSGYRDPVTPPEIAEGLDRRLPASRHVVFPTGGHFFDRLADPACKLGIVARFLDSAGFDRLDTRCVETTPAIPFVTGEIDGG